MFNTLTLDETVAATGADMHATEHHASAAISDSTQCEKAVSDAQQPDKAAIIAALHHLSTSGDVIELRAIHRIGKKRIDAGYFDAAHWDDLAEHAMRLSEKGAAVYVTLNPVDPQLHSRYHNRVENFVKATTTDKQIVRRRWLLVDLDPVRPAGTSSNNIQLLAAKDFAKAIYKYLLGLGWPEPLVAMSGNGYHLLYSIDLPNDEASTSLVKSVLATLADRFDDPAVKVDRGVYNPARICKLYGTIANKGDQTEVTPWRLSRLLRTPERVFVTAIQLEGLRGSGPSPLARISENEFTTQLTGTFSLDDFLTRHKIEYKADQHDGRERFKLAECPFNPEHINGESAIFRMPSGKLGFKCMHDSCSAKGWRDVRELLDGPLTSDVSVVSVGRVDGANPKSWTEPTPLPNALLPVDHFNDSLLPVALRDWVMDISHRMQCPADFPAVAALVALSSLIGARAVVQPKSRDDWQVAPNLWGMTVGRPGVKKSPALNEALKPLSRLQVSAFEKFNTEHATWQIECKVTAMQDDANAKKAKSLVAGNPAKARQLLNPTALPEEPRARRFIVNDATVEKLGELMQRNPWGTLSYRDELYGLLTSLDKQGQEGSRAFYLQSYDGNQGYTFDRIGRGTVHIPRICLAMIGGIQPGRIHEYVRAAVAGGSADDGLLQRFGLTVWPDHARAYVHVDQWPDTLAKQKAWAVFERLAELKPASEIHAVVWKFSPAAQTLFVEWLMVFESELRGDELHPAMVSHLAKYRKLIPALALVFALIDTPESGRVIHQAELARALAWGKYLRTHANRLYAAAVMPETTDAATLLAKIKGGKLVGRDGVPLTSFTPREVAQKCWAGLGAPDAVRKAAELLADYGWLAREVVASSDGLGRGRPSELYTVNPAVLRMVEG